MGNVMAASAPSAPVPFPATFQKPSLPDEKETLENPGTMEDLHKKCKEVYPVSFEGVKMMINKGLSSHFQISHTVNMSNQTPNGYRFGATYVGNQQTAPSEVYPILVGDIDPSGNLNANIIHQMGDRLRVKLATQFQSSKMSALQYTADYKGDIYTASLTLANPNLFNNTGVAVLHYLQSITKQVALGAELVYQRSPQIPGGEVAVLNAAGRYSAEDFTISGTLGQAGLDLCYWQKASEQLKIGVELETNLRAQESVTTVAYQVDLPRTDFTCRGSLDSNGNISAVIEKKLVPLPATFALSCTMNHSKNQLLVGAGVIIG